MTDLRKLARGQSCTLRLPGVCSFDPATVVLAHVRRRGHGSVGRKPHDLFGVHACSSCHDALDGRIKTPGISRDELRAYTLDALIETQQRLLDEGWLSVR